jgi:hypothetical protein
MTVPNGDVAAIFSKEFFEQQKAYLYQADAAASELGKLTSVSVRTLGYLGDMEADAKLLDAIHRISRSLRLRRP